MVAHASIIPSLSRKDLVGPGGATPPISGRNEQECPTMFFIKQHGRESYLGAFVKVTSSANALTRQHGAVCSLIYCHLRICLCFCKAGT